MVESGKRLGLGTGSAAQHVLDILSERLREGSLLGSNMESADLVRSLF